MHISAKQRRILSMVVAVLAAAVVWWTQQGDDGSDSQADDRSSHSAPSDAGSDLGTDSETGLSWVGEEQLPAEARETLSLIDAGGPYPYDRDGITFENREGILPDQPTGYYHEFTVPTPGEDDRGARRIVTGGDDEFFWTADHYASFERIRR